MDYPKRTGRWWDGTTVVKAINSAANFLRSIMKFSILLSLATAIVAAPHKRSSGRSLALPVGVAPEAHYPQITPFSLGAVTEDIDLGLSGTYILNFTMGSQKDPILALLDTGSSDLWVNKETHDPSKSKDGKVSDTPFKIGYQGKSGGVEGFLATDSLYFGDTKVQTVTFGTIDKNNLASKKLAFVGVGKKGLESTKEKYDNLPYLLVKSGVTDRAAFSLYLNTRQSGQGTALFGGIDRAKIDGDLVKFKSPDTPLPRPWVPVKSVKVNGKDYDINADMSLDSGYTLTTLPGDVVDEIAKLYSGARSTGLLYAVDCEQDESKIIEFNFEGLTIKVPINEFIWKYGTVCKLGAQKQSKPDGLPDLVLGATFMQNVYSVFDWEENTISIAQAKFTEDTDIEDIPPYKG